MVVREIAKIGIPSMIASDVNPAPALVSKIAARFNVRTFAPPKNMQKKEKTEIAGSMINLHERDALAAAIKCYRFYANRLRQIELSGEAKKDKLKHLVIQGIPLKIATGIIERELY